MAFNLFALWTDKSTSYWESLIVGALQYFSIIYGVGIFSKV